jgi:hypothetical protein
VLLRRTEEEGSGRRHDRSPEITDRLDRDHKEFSHQLYPQTVGKSVFMETLLEYGLDNLPAIRELIQAKLASGSENE